MSILDKKYESECTENKGNAKTLSLFTFLILCAVALVYLLPQVAAAHKSEMINLYEKQLLKAEDMPDSKKKAEFISYTTEALSDNAITNIERKNIDARYMDLVFE